MQLHLSLLTVVGLLAFGVGCDEGDDFPSDMNENWYCDTFHHFTFDEYSDRCVCADGYEEMYDRCVPIDLCKDNPCGPLGTCEMLQAGTYGCDCLDLKAFFNGESCECLSGFVEQNGTCVSFLYKL